MSPTDEVSSPETTAITRRGWLVRAGLLLAVLVLVGASLGWWAVSRDDIATVRIQSVAAIGPSQLRVQVEIGHPSCYRLLPLRVTEHPDRVELTARTISPGVPPFQVLECPASAHRITRQVQLSAPLGDRAVIDTSRSDGAPLPVESP
jgi:hypothetical protein